MNESRNSHSCLKGLAVPLLLCLSYPGAAPARPADDFPKTYSGRVWTDISECWKTLWPTVSLFIEEFGQAKLVANTADRIEYIVHDARGRARPVTDATLPVVLRAGCYRFPDDRKTPAFYRFLEVGPGARDHG